MSSSRATDAATGKEAYVQKRLDEQFRLWFGRATIWRSPPFLVLGILASLAPPEHSSQNLPVLLNSYLFHAIILQNRLDISQPLEPDNSTVKASFLLDGY